MFPCCFIFSLPGVTYAADLISFAALIHLLWPTHSSMYFNLKLETATPDDQKSKDSKNAYAINDIDIHTCIHTHISELCIE